MSTYSLAVVGGDGIGPDVTQAALAGVQAAAHRYGFTVRTTIFDLGAERFLRTGMVIDENTISELREHDAILLGAVGDPRVAPGVLEQGLIVALRVAFAQSVNIRPVRLYPGIESPVRGVTPENCDLVVIRENTEGLYTGGGSLAHAGSGNAVAIQNSISTAAATSEAVDFAFQLAQARRRRVTLCHKTNILLHAGQLWQETVDRIAERYPDVEHDYVHADAMCQHLPLDPGRFDVVVTDNLFGDIISDLGATVQGGLGLAASANFNPRGSAPSMYEPVHGSAPDIAGKGWANPAAAALSAALCLAGLGEREAALSLETAVASVLAELPAFAGPEMGSDTAGLGHRIAERVSIVDPHRDGMGEKSLMSALGRLAGRSSLMSE
ncbi:3-isopropylmalate dehydrogenase [Nesterenkonia natronophila]|uniref:3-isopropylmalate dehydrogenase n=1 Tax=Nesterenkonia natronophila TaxID=2174932 RepID=A0A3A4F9E3_9MICC|nr:3-isopropylmalate dehydrogenase [Nesterenkonia natronophila]RJN33130.1 3-isopropylmalate dehydrogenase [Nesterenkonia natronophila]